MTINELSKILSHAPQDFPRALDQYLSEGGNINERNELGYPLILKASRGNNLAAVKLLLENGADPNNSLEGGFVLDGLTALHDACFSGRLDEITDQLSIIDLLIKYGADINAKTHKVDPPLHYAIMGTGSSNPDNTNKIVKKLIEHNVNVNLRDESGNTAIVYAVERGYDSTVRSLVNAGADLEVLLKYPKLSKKHPARSTEMSRLEAIKNYRSKLFEILKEYNYIIPTPSRPYDPQTAQEVAEHNASLIGPSVDKDLDKLGLYSDIRNLIYDYLYHGPKGNPKSVKTKPTSPATTAISQTVSTDPSVITKPSSTQEKNSIFTKLGVYIANIKNPQQGTYYGRSNQVEKIKIAQEIQTMFSAPLKPEAFLSNLKIIHTKIKENKHHTGNPILHRGYGQLNQILKEAKKEILNSIKQEPYGHIIAELAEYIENARDNNSEKQSKLFGLRSDQAKKLKAANTILDLIKPGSKTDIDSLRTQLTAAIEINKKATVKTPFKGAGKLDSIFHGLLKEISSLPKPLGSI